MSFTQGAILLCCEAEVYITLPADGFWCSCWVPGTLHHPFFADMTGPCEELTKRTSWLLTAAVRPFLWPYIGTIWSIHRTQPVHAAAGHEALMSFFCTLSHLSTPDRVWAPVQVVRRVTDLLSYHLTSCSCVSPTEVVLSWKDPRPELFGSVSDITERTVPKQWMIM